MRFVEPALVAEPRLRSSGGFVTGPVHLMEVVHARAEADLILAPDVPQTLAAGAGQGGAALALELTWLSPKDPP